MVKAIRIEVDEETYEKLRMIKGYHGVTWIEAIGVGLDTLGDPHDEDAPSREEAEETLVRVNDELLDRDRNPARVRS